MENDRIIRRILFSCGLHALAGWALVYNASQIDTAISSEPIEIEIIQATHKSRQQFVPELKPESWLKNIKTQADFLSQFTRRVKQQMLASHIGKTVNRKGKGNKPTSAQDQLKKAGQAKTKQGHRKKSNKRLSATRGAGGTSTFGSQLTNAASTIGEYIPGIKAGYMTTLNTDRFTYYSFYMRLSEEIRNRWVQKLRHYSSTLTQDQLSNLAKIQRTTTIEVTLSASGKLLKTSVFKTSGDKTLDLAATSPWPDASPFQNPPKGMVQEDGKIRIQYGFVINWTPRRLSTKSSNRRRSTFR